MSEKRVPPRPSAPPSPVGALGYGFLSGADVPAGRDEYYLRYEQAARPADHWRPLTAAEIEALLANGNRCARWDDVRVADPFDPACVRQCEFYGLVRIGRLEAGRLREHEGLRLPVGLVRSRLIACDLGDDVAVHDVRYLSHYLVGDGAILLNVGEMRTSPRATVGCGIVKDGSPSGARITMDLVNEAGGRRVAPFDGMIAADAALGAMNPDLAARLAEVTQRSFDARPGFYGTVGAGAVVKHARTIRDCAIGPAAVIDGADRLENLTVRSSEEEPTRVGEGVVLVDGILGPGARATGGCRAERFVLGSGASLEDGACLKHSFVGDGGVVACGEVRSALLFPAHAQHHATTFLIAALVGGQANLAAGATIGSNHNSRAPDGEIHAGRGFWPGLCVSLKHTSRFAAFTLLAKGDYPSELDVRLPVSLLSNDTARDRLVIVPAYWWLYNMYALARNARKFRDRDRRREKVQKIEFEALAPDTVEEIATAEGLLEVWTARAYLARQGRAATEDPAALGRQLLKGDGAELEGLEVVAEGAEHSARRAVVLKVREAYRAYRQMRHLYAVRNLLDYLDAHPKATLGEMGRALGDRPRERTWVNLGGQLVAGADYEALREAVRSGQLATWSDLHATYERLWQNYPLDKQRHAWAILGDLRGAKELTTAAWTEALDEALGLQRYVADQVYASRKKDDTNPFRRMAYASDAEMAAVLGTADDNAFVGQVREETARFAERVAAARQRTGA